jgi:TolA-binding protein
MSDATRPEQLQQQLSEIDAEIAELRKSTDDLRARTGSGVQDAEEIAADLTSIEEQEAVLGILERRRESLLERLGGAG